MQILYLFKILLIVSLSMFLFLQSLIDEVRLGRSSRNQH